MKFVHPSTKETSFNCPHCGALAKQFWYSFHAESLREKQPLPMVIDDKDASEMTFEHVEDINRRKELYAWAKKMPKGAPFLEQQLGGRHVSYNAYNLHGSNCYNCKKVSIWIHDRLVFPEVGEVPSANHDMPEDIKRDYNEASSILSQSPRGAAALLRLAIQKLCKELGQPGKNINDDIGALVDEGLDPRVQKSLDVVRVIGNNAVHPGQMDLRDDTATAAALFKLLNLIVNKTISEPKHIDEVYNALPEGAVRSIEKRDNNK